MSDFKSGEDVLFNELEYVYIAKHPIFSNFSVIQAKHSKITSLLGDITYVATDDIKKKPKTHTVNGFEVPAPVSEEEFKAYPETELFYFSYQYDCGFDCARSIYVKPVAVKCGLIFKTKSDIIKNIAALQGIDPSGVQ